MRKRINVFDDVYDKLAIMAAEAGVDGAKQSEKIDRLFNDGVLFEKIDKCASKLDECRHKNEKLENESSSIDSEQLKRIEKLQAIGILKDDLPGALEALIDNFVEVNAEKIKELVVKI